MQVKVVVEEVWIEDKNNVFHYYVNFLCDRRWREVCVLRKIKWESDLKDRRGE